jgi:thiosulfate dehydrogenase (quinone) large subunit
MPQRARLEAIALVLLRTLIGWHFLYEGYYKLVSPGWTRAGGPIGAWSASGYLKAATGPLASAFHALGQSGMAGWWVDHLVPLGLVLVGLSLILGVFTQAGLWGALSFLTLFYVSAIPTEGVPKPGNEGTYLLVSKNLIEWAAVLVLITCRTGAIAGLDVLRRQRRA